MYDPLDISTWNKRRRYEQRHRDRHLCTRCSEPAVPGLSRCAKHKAKHNATAAAVKERRVLERLCIFCGRPLGDDDRGFKSHPRGACVPYRRIV
jgi:hypothetical protein